MGSFDSHPSYLVYLLTDSTHSFRPEMIEPPTTRPSLMHSIPGLSLFRNYRREWLVSDLVAGFSVCIVMIPSVIAYAGLMGIPPQHGLYAALVPLLVYPL